MPARRQRLHCELRDQRGIVIPVAARIGGCGAFELGCRRVVKTDEHGPMPFHAGAVGRLVNRKRRMGVIHTWDGAKHGHGSQRAAQGKEWGAVGKRSKGGPRTCESKADDEGCAVGREVRLNERRRFQPLEIKFGHLSSVAMAELVAVAVRSDEGGTAMRATRTGCARPSPQGVTHTTWVSVCDSASTDGLWSPPKRHRSILLRTDASVERAAKPTPSIRHRRSAPRIALCGEHADEMRRSVGL